jgi:TorA maturation chaperone TorD
MISSLETRAPIDAWLARVLACELDDEASRTMREEPLRRLLGRLEPQLGTVWPMAAEAAADRSDREDFARLFLLPGGVPPRAGAFLPGAPELADGHATALVDRSLDLLGRRVVSRSPWGRLPRDHFALILELVAHASCSDDPIDRSLARELDAALLGPRLVAFGEALAEAAEHPVYRAIGRLIALTHAEDSPHDPLPADAPSEAEARRDRAGFRA